MDYQPLQTRQTTGSYVFPTQNDTPQTDPDQLPLSTNRDLQMPTSPTDRPLIERTTSGRYRSPDSQEENVAKNTLGPTRANSEDRLQTPAKHKSYDKSKTSILKMPNPSGFGMKKSVTIMDKSKEKDNPLDFSGDILGKIQDIEDKNGIQNSRRGSLQKLKSLFTREKTTTGTTATNYEVDISFDLDEECFMYESEQLDLLNPNLNFWISEGEKISSKSKAKPRKAYRHLDGRKKDSMSMLSYETSCFQRLQNTYKDLTKDSCIFKPDSNFKISWDLFGMVFILYELIMIPLSISFTFESAAVDGIEWLIDVFFLTDILMTFNTGFYERGHLVINRKQIAKNYLRGWFWIDLFASFPYARIVQAEVNSEESGHNSAWIQQSTRLIRIIRFFRFVKVVRLIRVFKLKSIFSKFDFIEIIPSLNVLFGFLRLSAIILFIAHWIACFWHFIGDSESTSTNDTWITRQRLQDADWNSRYLASIYWAITTMITVGYGDIVPVTDGERVYSLFTMLIASGVFAYSMNNINALLIGIDAEEKEYKETIVWVQRYMRKMDLDTQTRAKVANYLRFTLIEANTRKDDENRLLSLLSDSLKDEVVKKINTMVLLSCETLNRLLLKNFTEVFIREMICFFKEKVLSPGEIIFDEEDEQIALYMINSGPVKIIVPSSREVVIRSYEKGDYFGQQEFFTGMDRRYRAKAGNDFVSLFFLKRNDFLQTVSDFPSEKEKFFQLKDKMLVYKDFSVLEQKCPCCGQSAHSPFECPYMHYLGDRTKFMKEQIQESYAFRNNFKRVASRHRVRNHQALEVCALRIRANFAKEIDALENETVNTDFLHSSSIRTEDMSIRKANEIATSLNQIKSISDVDDGEFVRSTSLRKKTTRATQKLNKGIKFEVEFDAVYSFKSYFPYNNVENVLGRINEKLKLAVKFKKMRILKKIVSVGKGLGLGNANTAFKKSPAKVPSFTPTHSSQTGKLNFTFLYNPHYDQRVQSKSSVLRRIPESLEMDPSGELIDRIAEEQVGFNKKMSRENQEFTKRMHTKFMPGEIMHENSIVLEDKDDFITEFDSKSGDYKSKFSKISKQGFQSQDEVHDTLDAMVEKYGVEYIQQILRQKIR